MSDERSRGFTESSVPDGYDRFMLGQLFEPWAVDLLSRAGLHVGQSVLDVASGLGPVARLAAAAVGSRGRVVASDISSAMLATAAARPAGADAAVIEYLECSATAIETADSSFDIVLCQQGLQFFPDRAAAAREMGRVVRVGGQVVVSTWAAEHALGLFGPILETLSEVGLDEPYPGAFDPNSYSLSSRALAELLDQAGLRDVGVERVELDAVWSTIDEALSTVLGTPFGPMVSSLSSLEQEHIRALLADKLAQSEDGTVVVRTMSNIARGGR
jgi:ubiquinone/menaquinone biosynthesis C-methylase UbiE